MQREVVSHRKTEIVSIDDRSLSLEGLRITNVPYDRVVVHWFIPAIPEIKGPECH